MAESEKEESFRARAIIIFMTVFFFLPQSLSGENKEQRHCSMEQLSVMMSLSGWAVHMCDDILSITLLTSFKKKKLQADTEDILHSREMDLYSYKLCFI